MNSKVIILVLNWNRKELTSACLDSLKELDYSNYEVLMIDNGSEDGSVEMIRARHRWVDIIENRENLGYAEGNNRGIRRALQRGADYIFIVNNDTKIHKDCVRRLVEAAEQNWKYGILGPVAFDYEGKESLYSGFVIDWNTTDWCPFRPVEGKTVLTQERLIHPVDIIQGDGFFVRRSVFERIGFFDVRFFFMHEESDFCCRAKKQGFGVGVVKNASFMRMSGATIGQGSSLQKYYAIRNMFLYISKNLKGLEKAGKMIWELKRMKWALWDHYLLNYLRTKDKKYLKQAVPALRGCFDYFLGRFGKLKQGAL